MQVLAGAITSLVLIFGVVWCSRFYDQIIESNQKAQDAFSKLLVYLRQRLALLPEMSESVRKYAPEEADRLMELYNLRNNVKNRQLSGSLAEQINAEHEISDIIAKIDKIQFPAAESKCKELLRKIKNINGDINATAGIYNRAVNEFNIKINKLPHKPIAKIRKIPELPEM